VCCSDCQVIEMYCLKHIELFSFLFFGDFMHIIFLYLEFHFLSLPQRDVPYPFTLIKRLFSSSLLCAIRVVSPTYLRLLIFLPAFFDPCFQLTNAILAFLIMYSAYKLNKHGDNIQPCCIPFPILNQSIVPCPVLTVVS